MEILIVSLLNGLVYGMLLFMLASGLTLIFSMMGVLNFAHASIYMLGAYFAFEVSRWVGFIPALIVAPILCGAIGAAIEIFGLRRGGCDALIGRFLQIAERRRSGGENDRPAGNRARRLGETRQ